MERKIIEFIPQTADGAKVRVNVALQDDFSMNQTLSLNVHDTLPLIDPAAPDYALVVLTMVESILEDPDLILRKQLDRVKGQAIAAMKAEGLDYNQRMEELEKLEYPKPNRDFIYSTFNAFAERHPWVGEENIRPKSIAREMFEEFRTFSDYIKVYELQRAEGLLLRHLSSRLQGARANGARTRPRTTPCARWNCTSPPCCGRSIPACWRSGKRCAIRITSHARRRRKPAPPGADAEAARDITRDAKAFTAAIRNRDFWFSPRDGQRGI